MQEIIKKAVEGGWRPTKYIDWNSRDQVYGLIDIFAAHQKSSFLDPLFWQAIGKRCGWCECDCGGQHEGECPVPDWQNTALRFYEINLTEGFEKAVEYLQNLIK